MATKPWSFEQLGGGRKTLVLAGSSAPHGRPRKNPVVTDGLRLRAEHVYYPGNSTPTTHVFGVAWKPWEISGRFSDANLGPGGSRQMIASWQTFLIDAQPLQITWGDVLTARGLLLEFTPGRESEFESSYKLEFHIDVEPNFGLVVGAFADAGASAICQELDDLLHEGLGNIPSLPNVGDLKPSFLDSLDDLVSSINGFSASLIDIAGEFDTFVNGTLNQLERLRAGVAQMRTAVLRVRGTIDTTTNEATMLSRSADSDILWFAARANTDVVTMRVLALLDEIDRQAEIAQRGRVLSTYVARGGDSWESIARHFYGSAQDAGRIRDANGIKYGEAPMPGRQYSIPVQQ